MKIAKTIKTDSDEFPSDLAERSGLSTAAAPSLSHLVVPLLKGVIYQEQDPQLWHGLVSLQAHVRDYLGVLGLELVLDESEGYAFLRSRANLPADEGADAIPRLVARRPLSFPVSLLLALLRKKLAEFDAGGESEGTRLVLARNDMVELIRVFLPQSSNEAKLTDQIDAHINKVVDLGFLRKLKTTAMGKTTAASFEVCRILKAFVDAQWLSEFDARLAQYQTQAQTQSQSQSQSQSKDDGQEKEALDDE